MIQYCMEIRSNIDPKHWISRWMMCIMLWRCIILTNPTQVHVKIRTGLKSRPQASAPERKLLSNRFWVSDNTLCLGIVLQRSQPSRGVMCCPAFLHACLLSSCCKKKSAAFGKEGYMECFTWESKPNQNLQCVKCWFWHF